jgi:hypothetical protein
MSPQVIAALIGIFGGCLAGFVTARLTWRHEGEKWRRAREDAASADLRAGVQQLILALASAVHSMCWLTWLAEKGPAKMTAERIAAYDDELHKVLPQILGYHALVSSLRPQVYQRFNEFIEKVYITDQKIGAAALKCIPGVPASCQELAGFYPTSGELEAELKQLVRSLLANLTRLSEAELVAAKLSS